MLFKEWAHQSYIAYSMDTSNLRFLQYWNFLYDKLSKLTLLTV
jgi:hypothetical protein